MIYYEPVKVNVLDLAEVIIDIVICHYRGPESILTDKDSLFTS